MDDSAALSDRKEGEQIGGKPDGKHRAGKRDPAAVKAARARGKLESDIRRTLANALRLSIAEHNLGRFKSR